MDDVVQAQAEIGRAIRKARAGEDAALAGRVREQGEHLSRVLAGALALARLHALDNRALDQPIHDLSQALATLVDLLGTVHLLTVEQQVYVNDIRIRLEGGDVGPQLGSRLARYRAGGLAFHASLSDGQLRDLIAALGAEPAQTAPRAALQRALLDKGLDSVEALGVHRFRVGQEGGSVPTRDGPAVASDGLRLVEESWAGLAAGRLPNPLPLRRLVCELIEMDPTDRLFWSEPASAAAYGAHVLRVCRLSLLMGRAVGLAADVLQDLGVAALFHDVGYASTDGASAGEGGSVPALARHGLTGARTLVRQRGFHEAKLRRMRAVLGHHRQFDDAHGQPALFARILAIAEDYDTLVQLRGAALSPHEALGRMCAGAGTVYDPRLLQAFANRLGRFPLNTLVRLEDGRVGRVLSLARDADRFARPLVRIACTSDGHAVREGEVVDLAAEGAPAISGVVDPKEAATWAPPPEPEPPSPEPAPEPAAAEAAPPQPAEPAPAKAISEVEAEAEDYTARPLYQGVLPTVLRDLYVARRTGVLHLTRRAERRSVRIWKGNVIHASSNRKEDHMGEVAVREGLISQADLDRANELAARTKKRVGVALRELGILDEERVENALAVHAREVIVRAFAWTDGYCDFEEQEAEPSWFSELALRLSTPDLILEAVRRIDDADVVRYHLGDIDRVLVLSGNPAAKGMRVSLTPLDGYVLSRIDGKLKAREILRIVPGEPLEVMRSLFGLICVGIVEYAPPADKAPAPAPEH
jgi:hypothetical protein